MLLSVRQQLFGPPYLYHKFMFHEKLIKNKVKKEDADLNNDIIFLDFCGLVTKGDIEKLLFFPLKYNMANITKR